MASLLERCAALRIDVAGVDVEVLSGEDCRALAEELARCEKAFAVVRARAGARAAACGAHRDAGFGDGAEWMARATGSSLGQARGEMRTVQGLGRCPVAQAALAAGEVSLAQAEEVARTEADCPGSEAELVALAIRSGLAALREEGRARRLAAVDPEDLAACHRRMRSVRSWRDADGMIRFHARLEPRVGVAAMNAIEAEAQRIHRAARRQGSDEPFEAHAADALIALLSSEGGARRGRTEVVFVCDLRAWRRGHANEGEPCSIVGGGPVPVSVVEEAMADAFVKAVTHDGVRIDTVAHYGRHIPAHVRTALDLGDPPTFEGAVCDEEGCERRWGLQWDHLDPVANGGATSLANLGAKCTPCHQEKTERDRLAGLLGEALAGRRTAAVGGGGPP